METLLLNAEETARLLGLGRTKVYEMLAAGELPVIRIGRNVRVPRDGLSEWIRQHTDGRDRRLTPSLDVGGALARVMPRGGQ